MIDDHDIARLDEIYVRKDDCQDIQSTVEKKLANGMEYDKVWKIIAELMETLQVINPRLYAGVIKKLKA